VSEQHLNFVDVSVIYLDSAVTYYTRALFASVKKLGKRRARHKPSLRLLLLAGNAIRHSFQSGIESIVRLRAYYGNALASIVRRYCVSSNCDHQSSSLSSHVLSEPVPLRYDVEVNCLVRESGVIVNKLIRARIINNWPFLWNPKACYDV
jgi:hypothetical protein